MKGAMVVARGTKSGTLYTTAGCINMAVVAEGDFGSCLWHNRLGHMSTKGMKMLVAKGALEGLKTVDMGSRLVYWLKDIHKGKVLIMLKYSLLL